MSSLRSFGFSLIALTVVWLVLTGADDPSLILQSLVLGIPTIILAAYSFNWLTRRIAKSRENDQINESGVVGIAGAINRAPFSWCGAVQFIPLFLIKALLGAIDVALLALAPKQRIRPGFCFYKARLQRPDAMTFFVYSINMLPGTVVVRRVGDLLELHALTPGPAIDRELMALEAAIARIFPIFNQGSGGTGDE